MCSMAGSVAIWMHKFLAEQCKTCTAIALMLSLKFDARHPHKYQFACTQIRYFASNFNMSSWAPLFLHEPYCKCHTIKNHLFTTSKCGQNCKNEERNKTLICSDLLYLYRGKSGFAYIYRTYSPSTHSSYSILWRQCKPSNSFSNRFICAHVTTSNRFRYKCKV